MEQVQEWLQFLTDNPGTALGIAAAVGAALFLLLRKPKHVREAEARLRKLRNERADQYRQMRPPH